ncbi:MAG: hypothetical protein J7501_10760 [Bdellovibrio sp.]|nr:hypothetical protein [Bdellovibrio sp.]
MNKKFVSVAAIGAVAVAAFVFADFLTPASSPRLPASAPAQYESLKACDKQNVLWNEIQKTVYKDLPDYRALGLRQIIGLSQQEISIKGQHLSDFAPKGWTKFLHGRASIAKIKVVPVTNKYSGMFQGVDCGLLRLSLTSEVTSSRPVAPGLALKVLRDGTYSTNISALVSLDGQGQDFNFFKYPMSNIVPIGTSFGQKIVHKIFLNASPYPEELAIKEFSEMDQKGHRVANPLSPRQVFFVPAKNLYFSSQEHDVRNDFAKVPTNTVIYQVRAVSDKFKNFDYSKYQPETVQAMLTDSEHIADIVTTSEFLSSSFGDDGIFFRHQLRE